MWKKTRSGTLSRCTEDGEALLARWKENRCKELYHLGQRERPEGLSPSVLYLYTVAEAFFRALTTLPELELLRERAQALLCEEETARLLQAVPFVIGAEYVNRAWLEGLFLRLNEVFSEEIGAYSGTVAFYLAEQSQRLRVPERVFWASPSSVCRLPGSSGTKPSGVRTSSRGNVIFSGM